MNEGNMLSHFLCYLSPIWQLNFTFSGLLPPSSVSSTHRFRNSISLLDPTPFDKRTLSNCFRGNSVSVNNVIILFMKANRTVCTLFRMESMRCVTFSSCDWLCFRSVPQRRYLGGYTRWRRAGAFMSRRYRRPNDTPLSHCQWEWIGVGWSRLPVLLIETPSQRNELCGFRLHRSALKNSDDKEQPPRSSSGSMQHLWPSCWSCIGLSSGSMGDSCISIALKWLYRIHRSKSAWWNPMNERIPFTEL